MALPRLAALALLLVAPGAGAQGQLDPVLMVDPLTAPIAPLQATQTTAFRLSAVCEPDVPGSPRVVSFWVEQAPDWATVVASPASAVLADGCNGTAATIDGALTIAANDRAPAGVPAPIVLAASYDGVRGNTTARATVNATADYFGILDVQIPESIAVAKPGAWVTFPLRLENLGNDDGVVVFELDHLSDGLHVAVPEPVTLESAQKGGTRTSQTVDVQVQAAEGNGYLNEVGTVTFKLFLTRASGGAEGDDTQVSFLLTTRGLATPAPGAWAALALAGVALARTRRPT